MGQLAALVSGKGGTGKTTLCACIAAGLARLGKTVLCIDADVGLRNLDLALGMSQTAVLPFTEVMDHPELLEKAPAHEDFPALKLLTAPSRLQPEDVDPARFAALLDQAAAEFDWVLVDAPAGVGPGLALAAGHVQKAIVVSNCEPASLRDAARAARVLETMGIKDLRLAVNRIRRRGLKVLGVNVDDAIDQTGIPLLGLVPETRDLGAALALGSGLTHYAGSSAVAACNNLARRLDGQQVPLMRIRS